MTKTLNFEFAGCMRLRIAALAAIVLVACLTDSTAFAQRFRAEDTTSIDRDEEYDAAKAALEAKQKAEEERKRWQPVFDAIAETNPTSPVELIGVIDSLINLDQPEEAKKYIQKLLALKLNDEAMYVLVRKVGSGVFFKLSADKRYHPEGADLATSALAAAHKQARDPKRIAQLVTELNNPSPSIRALAISDLKEAGYDAVIAMIAALADENRAAEHDRIASALFLMGEIVIDPLIGCLASDNPQLKKHAIEVLGRLETAQATPYLIYPLFSESSPQSLTVAAAQALEQIVRAVPTEDDAQRYLRRRVRQLYDGDLPQQASADGTITLWLWHPEKNLPDPIVYDAHDAALVVAAQLAGDLHQLWPDNKEYRRAYLMALLESTKLLAGLDRSLPGGPGSARELAAQTGAEALEDVLVQGMKQNRIAAAIGATEVLGDIGDESLLLSDDGQPRPLLQALTHGSRRLRFAAAEALMKIDPKNDYPGASHLPETLAYLAASSGTRRILIGHPRASDAQTLVGMLTELGFDAATANNGRTLFNRAIATPDFEMIFVSDRINSPALNETLQLLRRDRRTADIPIGLMVREENLRAQQLKAEDDPLTAAFPRPHDTHALQFQIRRLYEMAGRGGITDEERIRHASASLAWLSVLAESPDEYGFYDLLRSEGSVVKALFDGPVPDRAAEVLGLLGTTEAQRALVDFASQNARPLAQRQAAADGFATATQRRGLMLREDDVDQQYARYNQSEFLDTGTQALLGQILDVIEKQLLIQRTGQAEKLTRDE